MDSLGTIRVMVGPNAHEHISFSVLSQILTPSLVLSFRPRSDMYEYKGFQNCVGGLIYSLDPVKSSWRIAFRPKIVGLIYSLDPVKSPRNLARFQDGFSQNSPSLWDLLIFMSTKNNINAPRMDESVENSSLGNIGPTMEKCDEEGDIRNCKLINVIVRTK